MDGVAKQAGQHASHVRGGLGEPANTLRELLGALVDGTETVGAGLGVAADLQFSLGSGAADLMVKPGRIGELNARVAALLRRAYPENTGGVMEFGRYRFLPETRSIEKDGVAVELKNREYDLALFLFQNMGRLLSRDHLKEVVWGQVADVMSRSLDTHISRLRTLLDLRPANGFILTGG